MNYLNDELRNALAAEYVLGTLRGGARQRFQRLMMQYPSFHEATWKWEQHLNSLGQKIPPVEPSAQVWETIQQRLGFVADNHTPVDNVVTLPSRNHWWKGWSALATAAALVLAVLLVRVEVPPVSAPVAQQVSVVNNEQTEALWVLEVTEQTIRAQATSKLIAQQGKDYQLWMVAADGRAPIPLGILPKQGKAEFNKHPEFDQLEIAALAVSLEPLGGSPNGVPTEVLFTSELVVL